MLIERKKEWLSDCPADHLLHGRPQELEGDPTLPTDLCTFDQVFSSFKPTGGDDTSAFVAEKEALLEQGWNIDVLTERFTAEAHAARLHQASIQAAQAQQQAQYNNNNGAGSIFGVSMAPLSSILSPVKIKEEASQLIGFLKDGVSKVLSPPPGSASAAAPGEDYKLTSRRSANMITLIDNMELGE